MKGVFSPYYFRSSEWFTKNISKIVGKKSFLEVGTGTGITSLKCAENGAGVVAVDINSIAVRNAKINALLNDIKINIRKSDVFSNLKKSEKFDVIFQNHPFDDKPRDLKDELSKSAYDIGYKNTKKFIKKGKSHLKSKGRILLGTGSSANFTRLNEIAKKNKLKIKELKREKLPVKEYNNLHFEIILLEFV